MKARIGILLTAALAFVAITRAVVVTRQLPRDVVVRYCWLDAHGANYDSRNTLSKQIDHLLIDADEAAYDQSVVIGTYRVGEAVNHAQTAEVEVTYSVLGTVWSDLQTKREAQDQKVIFHLSFSGGGWLIDGLRQPPHVSKDWILATYRKDLKLNGHAHRTQPELNAAIREISAWH
jgi:hypothetical protein